MKNQTQVNRRLVIINSISNYGQYAVSILIGIFLQSYMIRSLGKNEYALWPLINTCMGLVALIPISIGSGTARFLAHALGSADWEKAEQITTSSFCALLATAAVYGVSVICLSIYFERLFNIPPGVEGVGPWAMLLMGLSGMVAIPFSTFNGGLRAAQKFVILNILQIVLLTVRMGIIVIAFTLSAPSLIQVGGIYLILELANGVVTFLIARKVVPWNRVRWKSFNWKILWEVNNFSLLVLIIHVAHLLYWRTDNIIINKLLDPTMLTGYSVVVNFVVNCYQLSSLGTAVLKPTAVILHAENNVPRLRRLLYRTNRIIVPVTASILFFLIIYGQELLDVYVGPSYREYAVLFPILAGVCIFSITQGAAASIVPHAFGRLLLVSSVLLIGAVANVILSIFFVVVFKWGLIGVAAGTAVVKVIETTVFWPWYIANLLNIPLLDYLYESYLVPVGNCLPAVLVLLGLRWIGFGKGLIELVSVTAIVGFIESIYLLVWGIDQHDRKAIMLHGRRFWSSFYHRLMVGRLANS
ncbi:MAG: hypothetical protein K6U11_14710 [bacterium]|nr:hypothetical protein [bacterium]